ncbi:MAG TPA: 16S rRNA (adenine(1518)-N(6)/adenine(1519)-N(6))-dimethyltransferase RsmA [Candidatus Saccharimonadales bacterium]|nr:16S rRNA (adenine(1518)-N(6)/adenine(1519)-N(6))-dimethyltransferase RsmA [Candidatus Saccharimonadales bacterium]
MKPKKSLGQHWLEDNVILQSICEVAGVESGDIVLEIGPGKGTLTRVLLEKGANVTAVELDEDLAAELEKQTSENFRVVRQDILNFNLNELPLGYKVVANIPYYLTSNLIRILSESSNPADSITLLVQKEVAERVCAEPGEMSLLSVSAQIYFQCAPGPLVPAEKFIPPPKVDSQVVHMVRREKPLIAEKAKKHFFRIVKAGFSSRRKTIENSLSGGLRLSKQELRNFLKSAGIEPNKRPQELSIKNWEKISEAIPPAELE